MFGFLPNSLFLWAPIAITIIFLLRQTGYGRLLYAIGDNRDACELSGIRVWRVVVVTYIACSVLAAIAGLVIVGAVDAANLSLADVYLLPSVAAVIIGGTSIFGGRGGYAGTIIGALILTVLNSILTLLDVPEPVRQILYGAIILLLAAAYTRLTSWRRIRRSAEWARFFSGSRSALPSASSMGSASRFFASSRSS